MSSSRLVGVAEQEEADQHPREAALEHRVDAAREQHGHDDDEDERDVHEITTLSPALSVLNAAASAHHEKCNGSGYHRRLRAEAGDRGACVLAAAEIYVGMTSDRADRPRLSDDDAAAELRRLETDGALEPSATRAVLVAAGHGEPATQASKRPKNRGGLSRREVDVLQLAARGLTTREIADRLVISPKTADHHIQHIYTKIDVSTRAAAALWAMQNNYVNA